MIRRALVSCLASLLLLAYSAFGQASAGTAGISGVVRDPSAGAVPNAKVVISSAGQGTIRSLTTNVDGVFTAPALTPGPGYKVTVTAAGFNEYVADNLELRVGQNLDLHVALGVGTTTTSVEVTAAAELVEDTKTDLSGVVNQRSIENLPINGRR